MSADNTKNNGAGMFLILTLIFLGISVWQTGLGYALMFGSALAWVFSIALGLMMLFLAFQIRKNRIKGHSVTGQLIGYFAVALFSFFGNFNALYTNFNKEELYKKELQEKKNELSETLNSSVKALENYDPNTVSLLKEIKAIKTNLLQQIRHEGNPGVGKEAKMLINDINELLVGKEIGIFRGSDASALADEYDRVISDQMENILEGSNREKALFYCDSIKKIAKYVEPVINDALKPQNVKTKAYNAIITGVEGVNQIGQLSKSFIKDTTKFNFTPSEFKNQEVGKISHSFSSAFNGRNTVSALLILIVAIAIDALVPFVIFVGTRKEDSYSSSNGERAGVEVIR